MTLSTVLTLLRIVLAFRIIFLLLNPGDSRATVAVIFFMIASFTDWLDGYLARRWRQISALGALLDPIADKVLVLGILGAFALQRVIPAFVFWLIAVREALVTIMRLAAARRGIVLSAEKDGKLKMAVQLASLFFLLLGRLDLSTSGTLHTIGMAFLWAALALTLFSGARFFRRNRSVVFSR